jgi:hypothetical protein
VQPRPVATTVDELLKGVKINNRCLARDFEIVTCSSPTRRKREMAKWPCLFKVQPYVFVFCLPPKSIVDTLPQDDLELKTA